MKKTDFRHRPRKRFGQHFLVNEGVADRIVDHAGINDEDTVLEIGPGKGILTERLLKRAGKLVVVEIDRDLAGVVQRRFGDNPKITIIVDDILNVDYSALFKDTPSRVKVVANIPYNISSPIIEQLIRYRAFVSQAVLMVQREVADRLVASTATKAYGLLTLNASLCAKVTRVMDVKPGSFNPPPDVVSTVINLDISPEYLYQIEDHKLFRAITGAVFRQRRKMLRNSVASFLATQGLDKELLRDVLDGASIDGQERPERIEVEGFVRLSNYLSAVINSGAERQ